ncbi:MAG TPA: MFS transporter [Tepidisphaeraceae bacterium]|nr:MFS transporter [Tepidisphaeraceae bacterium]
MPATRTRYILLYFACALSVITYIDRVCIGSSAPAIRAELGLTAVQMGWVFSAFTLAYALFEIPSGWLGDVLGPRKTLMRIVLWWSAFTTASGIAWNFPSLLIARFLFGAGEAGAYPNMSRSFSRWFPATERGGAHGAVFMSSRLGGAIAPPLVILIISAAGWRASFWIFGLFGIVWSVFWWHWFRDDPATHPSVSGDELAVIRAGTPPTALVRVHWRDLLDVNLLCICTMYFCIGYGLYFYLTWLPTYFKEARGFSTKQAAWLSGAVLLTEAVAAMAGGWLTDRLTARYGLKVGRSIGGIAMPLSGLFILSAAFTSHPIAAAVSIALAAGFADLSLSPSWAMCHDVGGEAAGTVTGAMNTLGNLGGAISPLVVGYSVQMWGSWSRPLVITAFVYGIGGVLTFLCNPHRRLVFREQNTWK